MAQMHSPVIANKSTLPDGPYRVRITECVEKRNDKAPEKNQFILNIRYTILEGDYRGMYIYENFCTYDPENSQYYQICMRALGELAIACGFEKGRQINDTDDFLNKEVIVTKKTSVSKEGKEYPRYTYSEASNSAPVSGSINFVQGNDVIQQTSNKPFNPSSWDF